MNQHHILLAASALFATAIAGCASDPNKNVQEARTEELGAQREAREDAAEADRKRAEGRAGREQNAGEARADRRYGDSATGDRVVAESKMTEERQKYRAQIDERVKKLDARTAELRAKLDQAGPKASTEARDRVEAIKSQRELVGRETNGLGTVKDDGWASAKKSMDTRVDELEAIVKRAADKVENK
jgi:outer membrane murein-binding lipoprotein Lpp